ncbi:protein of unknown function [Cupriavidus taiwanensis]|uniref:Uncharacterized protein n=1 Tax=Cupriavidus taiwanensis TaxID=164546 RepID=A0A375ICX6_9BURK|nr:hypothetical protein CBM2591_A270010 [Cupriavidus taiwanensis]SOZ23540.1 hypothetical protein CBM2608_A270008 [Cupriavidus taiwanensis]SPA28076.1 hypothetical protein CBM2623_A260093 [Cupriavidus taiwanensis]SPD44360.1 protein of unknown function [Cupriavidus taiwanensis]SPK71115.1 protein of unknown function [Cupriavidus taiwanensis]
MVEVELGHVSGRGEGRLCVFLPSPARGRGVGGEGRSISRRDRPSHRLPSPPAPLPRAGEGSKPSGRER